MTYKPVTSLQ